MDCWINGFMDWWIREALIYEKDLLELTRLRPNPAPPLIHQSTNPFIHSCVGSYSVKFGINS
jgi:hypothetical protein